MMKLKIIYYLLLSKIAKAHELSQRKVQQWQFMINSKCVIIIFALCSILFLFFGIIALSKSNSLLECSKTYDENIGETTTIEITEVDCTKNVNEITSDLFLYYKLTNYYQNFRRYTKSKNTQQLKGVVYTEESSLYSCESIIEKEGLILHPCGLVALSVFNDSFHLFSGHAQTPVKLDETVETLCKFHDVKNQFKNPSAEDKIAANGKVNFWLESDDYKKLFNMDQPGVGIGVENSHFIVWMKNAALPTFLKLYARIPSSSTSSTLQFPIKIEIKNNYPVKISGSTKSVVLSESSWMGSKNSSIGVIYLVLGSVCLSIFGVFAFLIKQKPRRLGDLSLLRQNM